MLKKSTKLLDHQDVAVDFFTAHKYVLCGDDMGLGKSLESLAFAVRAKSKLGQILICAPAFLKYNWANEFEKFTEGLSVQVVNGLNDIPSALFADIIIINYARLEMCAQLFARCNTVIADEAHYLKNVEANRTALFHQFIKAYKPENLILLTGTPVKNKVPEFYSLLKLLAYCPTNTNGKKITDKFKSENEFSKHFSFEEIIQFKIWSPQFKRQVTVKKSVFKGLRNEEELKTYFQHKYIRRLTNEVITLPEMTEKILRVKYTSKDTKMLREWEKFENINDNELDPESPLATLKKKSAISKAPFTASVAKNYHEETGEKVVIFSDHIDSTKLIAEKLKVPYIIGSTTISNRQKLINRFVDGDLQYFVATIYRIKFSSF